MSFVLIHSRSLDRRCSLSAQESLGPRHESPRMSTQQVLRQANNASAKRAAAMVTMRRRGRPDNRWHRQTDAWASVRLPESAPVSFSMAPPETPTAPDYVLYQALPTTICGTMTRAVCHGVGGLRACETVCGQCLCWGGSVSGYRTERATSSSCNGGRSVPR